MDSTFHSSSKCLVSTSCMPGTVCSQDDNMNETDEVFVRWGRGTVLVGEGGALPLLTQVNRGSQP